MHNSYLGSKIVFGGIEPRSTRRTTYGIFGIDTTRQKFITAPSRREQSIGIILAMTTAVITIYNIAYIYRRCGVLHSVHTRYRLFCSAK